MNWTGVLAGTIFNVTSLTVKGSLTLGTGMVMTGGGTITMSGNVTDPAYTITTNGVSITSNINCNLSGKTLTFNDHYSGISTALLQVKGTILFNNKDFTIGRMQIDTPSVVTMGTGLFKLTGSGTVWNNNATTFTTNTSTIEMSDATLNSKTFTGGGKIYNKLLITGAGNASYTFSGNNSFFDF